MSVTTLQRGFLVVAILLLLSVAPSRSLNRSYSLFAQDVPKAERSEPANDPDAVKKLIDQIRLQEADVPAGPNALPENPAPHVMVMLDLAQLDLFNVGNAQSRNLIFHLLFANPTSQDFRLSVDDIAAEIDGEKRSLKDLPQRLQNGSIPHGRKQVPISSMNPPKDRAWTIPANATSDIWIVYAEIPVGANVPKCKLKIKLGESTKELDINEIERARLKMTVERIGPRQCLALFTLGGTLTTINAGSLVEELEKLVDQKVARVVIRWGAEATPPEKKVLDWLQTTMQLPGVNPNQHSVFPVIPASIREFHLTAFRPNEDVRGRSMAAVFDRPHRTGCINRLPKQSVPRCGPRIKHYRETSCWPRFVQGILLLERPRWRMAAVGWMSISFRFSSSGRKIPTRIFSGQPSRQSAILENQKRSRNWSPSRRRTPIRSRPWPSRDWRGRDLAPLTMR